MGSRRRAGLGVLVLLTLVAGWRLLASDMNTTQAQSSTASAAQKAPWSPVKVPGPEEHAADLIKMAEEVRALRSLRVAVDGVPDYKASAVKQRDQLPIVRQKLEALRPDGWSIHDKVDFLLLRAELNAVEFQLQVFRPTTRNPSFYMNAAIDNVGRHLTGERYMRGDLMPYSKERAQAILKALADTDKILAQGRANLTEIVPELVDVVLLHPGGGYYTKGGELEFIEPNLAKWARLTAEHFPKPEADQLAPAAAKAAKELLAFGEWLKQNKDRWKGKTPIGAEALNWYTRNVLMMPYDIPQLELMARMERARALSFIQFEQQKNRDLPPIKPARTYKEYLNWDDETALILRRWYVEDQKILSDRDYMDDVRSEEGLYLMPFGLISFPTAAKPGVKRILLVPADHWRAVYSNMGFRTDPGVLHGHEYWPGHYYEGEIQRRNPCPIRRGHRDGAHSQGWCFYHEELPVLLDFPYVRGPRTRELVYINVLQRSDRISLGIKLLTRPDHVRRGARDDDEDGAAARPGPGNAARGSVRRGRGHHSARPRSLSDGEAADLPAARGPQDAAERQVRPARVPRPGDLHGIGADRAAALGNHRARRRDSAAVEDTADRVGIVELSDQKEGPTLRTVERTPTTSGPGRSDRPPSSRKRRRGRGDSAGAWFRRWRRSPPRARRRD